jgi:hypothetical protein
MNHGYLCITNYLACRPAAQEFVEHEIMQGNKTDEDLEEEEVQLVDVWVPVG